VGFPGVGATSENKKLRRWAPSSYKRSYIVTIYYTYCRVIVLVTLFVMPFFLVMSPFATGPPSRV